MKRWRPPVLALPSKAAKRIRAWSQACDGSITAEFALIIPLMLMLIFGTIEFGRAMWIRNSLQSAVEDAARCYALARPACDTTAKLQSYAASVAIGVKVNASIFTPSDEACGKKVIASYSFTSVVPLIPLHPTIRASACRPTTT